MAHRQLPLRRNLGKGEPERLVQRVRIVTEPIRPTRLVDNLARDFSAKRLQDPSPFRQRESRRADEKGVMWRVTRPL